jgi:hypothetical protein
MIRRAILAVCVCAFGLSLAGCGGGGDDKANNPSGLEYSKEGPPKRDGAPGKKK